MEVRGIGLGKFLKLVITLAFFLNNSFARSADLTEQYLQNKPSGNSLNEKQWQKLKDDYKYKTPKVDKSEKKETKSVGNVNFGGGLLKILAYAFIFIFLAGLIYWLVRNGFLKNNQLPKGTFQYDINIEPEDINTLKIDPLLAQALINKDFRLATRLRFLALLQSLNKKGFINWKRDKTNLNYKHQLEGKPVQLMFWQLCHSYERVWYGNYDLDEKAYQNVSERFDLVFSMLNTKVNV